MLLILHYKYLCIQICLLFCCLHSNIPGYKSAYEYNCYRSPTSATVWQHGVCFKWRKPWSSWKVNKCAVVQNLQLHYFGMVPQFPSTWTYPIFQLVTILVALYNHCCSFYPVCVCCRFLRLGESGYDLLSQLTTTDVIYDTWVQKCPL